MIQANEVVNAMFTYDLSRRYNLHDIVFLDIETTGFYANSTVLYLIGCVYYRNNKWNVIQWFADTIDGEQELLYSFFNFITQFKVIINYNGNGFDLPYIQKKCDKYNLPFNFDNIESFDIYRNIIPLKKILKLDNLKQRSIEQYLNIVRDDKYNGGELIEEYFKYLKFKDTALNRSKELYGLLTLHNLDDLRGMLGILDILSYTDIFTGEFYVTEAYLEENELVISLILNSPLPKRISYGNNIIYLSAFKEKATVKVKLYKGELRFFYDDYKDYYYLPEEDQAIHKSMAFYVDKHYRVKAKAANCYSKKTGCFVPQYDEIVTPYFKIDFYDKVTYIEPTEELLGDMGLLKEYCFHVLQKLLN